MSTFYKTSVVWVVDFRYEGHPRRWFKALPGGVDASQQMGAMLQDLYGDKAQLESVRPASPEEETQYLRGDEPRNAYCPTLRSGRHEPPA